MFSRVLSALFSALAWVFKSAVIKFVLFFGMFFVVTEFVVVLAPMLPGASSIQGSLAALPSGVWYWLDLFKAPTGLVMCLSAFVTRFIIRRIPVIG